jgi:hypothetical protein
VYLYGHFVYSKLVSSLKVPWILEIIILLMRNFEELVYLWVIFWNLSCCPPFQRQFLWYNCLGHCQNNCLIFKLNDLISLPPFLLTFSSLIPISLFFPPHQHNMKETNNVALFMLMIFTIIHIKFDIDINNDELLKTIRKHKNFFYKNWSSLIVHSNTEPKLLLQEWKTGK